MATKRPERRAADRPRLRGARDRRRPAPPNRALALAATVALVGVLGWLSWLGLRGRPHVRDGSPSWSPDSKQLVFYSERGGRGDLYLMNADGSGVEQVTDTPEDEGSPVFSPDGRHIAFDSDREGNFEIFVLTLANQRLQRLTSDPGRDVSPAWSPDGSRIVFMSDRAKAQEFDVYAMNADGTGVERLTELGSAWFPQFASDGQRLAFHVGRDVHTLDLRTRALRRLTTAPADGMHPTFSPDGSTLAFMTSRGGRMEIFTMSATGGDATRLVATAAGGAIDPRWSPDGTRIAYVQVSEPTVSAAQQPEQTRAIYVVEVASGRVTRLSR
jgi:Tol biopolymer transport system component